MVELAGVRGEQIGDQWLAGASVPVSNVEGVWKFGCLLQRVGCCDGVV